MRGIKEELGELKEKIITLEKDLKDLKYKFDHQKTFQFIEEARKRNYFNKDYCFNYFYRFKTFEEEPELTKGFARFDELHSNLEGNIFYYEKDDEFWIPIYAYNFDKNPVITGRVCIYRKGIWAPIIKVEELEERYRKEEENYFNINIKFNYIYGK
jgi:hypothetical protein